MSFSFEAIANNVPAVLIVVVFLYVLGFLQGDSGARSLGGFCIFAGIALQIGWLYINK
jgi:hypothetical protein